MQRLELIDGQADPAQITLTGETVIGRGADAALRIFDETASRRHALIVEAEGRIVLRDLGSANGTQLNGEPVDGEAALFDGDVIEIGDVRFRFLSGDGSERQTVVPGATDEVEAAVDPDVADPFVEGAGRNAVRRLRLVCEAAVACADASDSETLPADLLALIEETFDPDRSTVCLLEVEGRMRVAAARPATARPPASRTLRERVLERGEAVLIRDAEEENGETSESMVRSRFRSSMAAPLKTAEGILGFVTVDAVAPGTYDAGDLRALAAVARQAALAIRTLRALSGARLLVRHLAEEKVSGAPVILGESEGIETLRAQIAKVAGADSPVLVVGETGTGKELVARRLHAEGPRRGEPFVALNCAALVAGLLESEKLFGHEKGAFTDAKDRRDGRIAEAAEGTLFLDEIGDMPLALQAKLLRVLSERTFRRVGGKDAFDMKCRIITATNRDLKAMVKEGAFREDLYYRLAVVVLTVPPLRDRPGDVELLAEAGLERLAARLGRRVPRMAEDARETLSHYVWPGNVRELFNVLERALVLLDDDTLTAADLLIEVREPDVAGEATAAPIGEAGLLGDGVFDLKELERLAVKAALEKTGGKKGEAARLLGVSWPTLNRKIKQYGLG